jgi:hypothetical protein
MMDVTQAANVCMQAMLEWDPRLLWCNYAGGNKRNGRHRAEVKPMRNYAGWLMMGWRLHGASQMHTHKLTRFDST